MLLDLPVESIVEELLLVTPAPAKDRPAGTGDLKGCHPEFVISPSNLTKKVDAFGVFFVEYPAKAFV
jgi:hypothetical protein